MDGLELDKRCVTHKCHNFVSSVTQEIRSKRKRWRWSKCWCGIEHGCVDVSYYATEAHQIHSPEHDVVPTFEIWHVFKSLSKNDVLAVVISKVKNKWKQYVFPLRQLLLIWPICMWENATPFASSAMSHIEPHDNQRNQARNARNWNIYYCSMFNCSRFTRAI